MLEQELLTSLDQLEGSAPLLGLMSRYHLGWVTSSGEPTDESARRAVQGKRIRPLLAMLSAGSVGAGPEVAAPLAAGIELLHNFTLLHDDIQDRSPNRRHRSTVWRTWGDAQAINAGDAMFAAAGLAVLRTDRSVVAPDRLLDLLAEFNRVTIEIVRGQVLDLEFEGRDDVAPEAYLGMIRAKTAVIVRFATWAGALVGGADPGIAHRLADFGESLGVGFQIRDDLLGIWGAAEATGKDAADDIRRRKQSLPILLLREQADEAETAVLDTLYAAEEINADGIATVLTMLDQHGVHDQVAAHVASFHERALRSLADVRAVLPAISTGELAALAERLELRGS